MGQDSKHDCGLVRSFRDHSRRSRHAPYRKQYNKENDAGTVNEDARAFNKDKWPLATFTHDSMAAVRNASLPLKWVALDDALVFHMLLCRRNTAANAAKFAVDFDDRGDIWDSRIPRGGGVFVYLRPTSRWYVVEAQGFYLLGGDEIKEGGRWSFDSYLKGCKDRNRPVISFGNFRMPANWRPRLDALTWEYEWSDVHGDFAPVQREQLELGKMRFVRDVQYRVMEYKRDGFKVADGTLEDELAKKVAPREDGVQRDAHQAKTEDRPGKSVLTTSKGLKRHHKELLGTTIGNQAVKRQSPTRDNEVRLRLRPQRSSRASAVERIRQTSGTHAAPADWNHELQTALSYSKVEEQRDHYKEVADRLTRERQQKQDRNNEALLEVKEALQMQARKTAAVASIISDLKKANDDTDSFIKKLGRKIERLSDDNEELTAHESTHEAY